MKASISYKVANIRHPWRETVGDAWCLIKVTKPEFGDTDEEPVAVFNLDSEAHQFQGEVLLTGLDELITVDPSLKDLIATRLKLKGAK